MNADGVDYLFMTISLGFLMLTVAAHERWFPLVALITGLIAIAILRGPPLFPY